MKSSAPTLKHVDEGKFNEALKSVRKEKGEIDWLLLSYSATDTLSLVAQGADGGEGLLAAFEPDNINFGYLRVTDVIDNKSNTIKFVLLRWCPETVKPMKRAELTTRSGLVDKIFQPFHVAFDFSTKGEVTMKEITAKVGQASGSKSNVVDKK